MQQNKNITESTPCSTNTTKRTLNNLRILSWNIQSSNNAEGNKFEDNDFIKLLNNQDIICLQEVRQGNKIPGFRLISNLRSGEKDGGVSILYKNELHNGIKHIKKYEMDDLLICKLNKTFFKFNYDVFIINVYIPPHNSTRKSPINGKEMISNISEIINELKNKGEIIICGDFNSRISNHPGQLEYDDCNEHIPLPTDYNPNKFIPRQSKDKHKNPYTDEFLSLILNNNLTILNGRTLGDLSGSFTSINHNGCSVIDYFSTTSILYSQVSLLEVKALNYYSDHCPLELTLKTNQLNLEALKPMQNMFEPAPRRFIFDDSSKAKFIDAQKSDTFHSKSTKLKEKMTTANKSDLSRKEIISLNSSYIDYLQEMASSCFKSTSATSTKVSQKTNNRPWFKKDCQHAKTLLRRAARVTSNFPDSTFLKTNYYHVKKFYWNLIKKQKNLFFDKISNDIESGKILNWQQFKRLKNLKTPVQKFDSLDMNIFEKFFASLYTDDHHTIDSATKKDLINKADHMNVTSETNPTTEDILNSRITDEEVQSTIKSLKSGKASSDDMIANEILKSLDPNNTSLLTDFLNTCLDSGVYPWNLNIITPIHKNGSKDDPDNYRAIAVCSALGKLFSKILLDRFIKYRRISCPDSPNQLGFTKNAQTYDHILTMQTISSKYKKLNLPVYVTFVDFRKAFDSVCRQALFYKLAQNKVTGKFYNILKDMYSNSVGRIKMSGHISNPFDINKGTEQGHPLSPDLFKFYLSDLSPSLEFQNCPELSNTIISHLLWADDLIMTALDKETAQNQINNLNEFCIKWGIEVNISKTKSMVMGKQSKNNEPPKFTIGGKEIKYVNNYCYLGIILENTGSLKLATESLKEKSMRAFFGLKRTINKNKTSFRALTTLFDSLIKPITLYGAPIWIPSTHIINKLSTSLESVPINTSKITMNLTRMPCEKIHLSYLRWALGVHKKASTIGCWGETGRYPLIYQSIKLTLNYYKRLSNLKTGSLVHAAFLEQKSMKLNWYKNIESLLKLDALYNQDHVTVYRTLKSNKRNPNSENSNIILENKIILDRSKYREATPIPSEQFRIENIMQRLKGHFNDCWKHEKATSAKLSLYYHKIKVNFCKEQYLDYVKNARNRHRTTRLRISAHDLEIETGRYKGIHRSERTCKWCSLTLGSNELEDESHMLFNCDLYASIRIKLIKLLNNTLIDANLNKLYSETDKEIISLAFKNINYSSLKTEFHKLQSTCHTCNNATLNPLQFHLKHAPKTSNCEDIMIIDSIRLYIQNSLSSFISKCFDIRYAFLKDLAKNAATNAHK